MKKKKTDEHFFLSPEKEGGNIIQYNIFYYIFHSCLSFTATASSFAFLELTPFLLKAEIEEPPELQKSCRKDLLFCLESPGKRLFELSLFF